LPEPGDHEKRSITVALAAAGIEPLLGIDDLAAALSCGRRLVERMRAAGKLPRPDLKLGKMPRWRASTIRRWIEGGGRP
jgi:predicted DNA-binding transcriptional regulator AlpA